MYSISVCVRVVLTFGILTIAFDWYFPTIACVLLAIFNDGSMLSISKDKVKVREELWCFIIALGQMIQRLLYSLARYLILGICQRSLAQQ